MEGPRSGGQEGYDDETDEDTVAAQLASSQQWLRGEGLHQHIDAFRFPVSLI
jgi:hypothetical protein